MKEEEKGKGLALYRLAICSLATRHSLERSLARSIVMKLVAAPSELCTTPEHPSMNEFELDSTSALYSLSALSFEPERRLILAFALVTVGSFTREAE
jgi:hypothetical protein